ncbi:Haze protective factor 1 [Streptomyces sp. NPDC058155]|uniref:Haze protective factor 1 n=1 Tax=Streptomyces sp. NPDC058155 TaxID=3346359 RepID=UPI0036EA4B19
MDIEGIKAVSKVPIDRSVFGLDEMRRPRDGERPMWVDLPMDGAPVIVGQSAVRFLSNAQSHDALVEVEVCADLPKATGDDFELLGEWPYTSASGDMLLCNLDGPELHFRLAEDSTYLLRVWRKGGDSSAERFDELLGDVFPIIGLEEYRIVFTPTDI